MIVPPVIVKPEFVEKIAPPWLEFDMFVKVQSSNVMLGIESSTTAEGEVKSAVDVSDKASPSKVTFSTYYTDSLLIKTDPFSIFVKYKASVLVQVFVVLIDLVNFVSLKVTVSAVPIVNNPWQAG